MKVSSPYDSSVDPLELQEREQIVEEVLNSLKPPTKEIFIWCYVDRKHYKEVAQRLGVSVSMVKKHISKALAIIREKREKLKI
jgi:RNA polymerase sigma-70 factor (ECF subfamily)